MTTTTGRDHVADAAALILAEAKGDDEAVRLIMTSLLEQRDLRGALLTLKATIVAAGLAVNSEAARANEAGDASTPSVDILVGLTQHGRADR